MTIITPTMLAASYTTQRDSPMSAAAARSGAGLDFNDPRLHQTELPSANGICTARSFARMYAATIGDVDGVRLLKPESVEAVTTTQVEGRDQVLFRRNRYGLGLLRSPSLPLPTEGALVTPVPEGHSDLPIRR